MSRQGGLRYGRSHRELIWDTKRGYVCTCKAMAARLQSPPMKSKITSQIAGIVVTVVVSSVVSNIITNYDRWLPHRWQTYTAPDGRFSIELPGKPVTKTGEAPVDGGGTGTYHMISTEPTASTSYSCIYIDKENNGKKSPDEALTSGRDGSLGKIQGIVLSEKRIEVEGHPAPEMHASARGNSLFDCRYILDGNRLYMVIAIATVKEDREAGTVQRVMDSFKIFRN